MSLVCGRAHRGPVCGFLVYWLQVAVEPFAYHNGFDYTLQPLYKTVRYNTVLDITRFKDGSQKCIDYVEK